MKILKIFGFVVGIHLFALLLIFANPGCSSTTKAPPAPSDTLSRTEPPPSVSVPTGPPAVALTMAETSPMSGAAPAFNPDAPAAAAAAPGVRFTPTRPGTPVASTLTAEPVADVTPATTYTVAGGDNLWSLSKRFKISTSEIAAANGLKTNAVLRPGQKLVIPSRPLPAVAGGAAPVAAKPAAAPPPKPSADAVKHIVKPGETLSMIAQQYGVKQGDIAVANNISDPQKIRAGAELTIPGWKALAAKSGKGAPKGSAAAAAKEKEAPAKAPDSRLIFSLEPSAAPAPKASTGAPGVPVIRVDESPIAPAPAPKNP